LHNGFWNRLYKSSSVKILEPPKSEHVKVIMECFCDLYTEGLTITELKERTDLKEEEISRVIEAYKGLFFKRKFETSEANIIFLYLQRARSLKCAYTLFQYSNITSLDFGWNQEDTDFIFEMTNPKYIYRTFFSVRKSLGWSRNKLKEVIERWQEKGIICKNGKRVSFTYLGWPLWASIIVARIWMKEESK